MIPSRHLPELLAGQWALIARWDKPRCEAEGAEAVSLEVLRIVRRRNREAREEEQARQAELGRAAAGDGAQLATARRVGRQKDTTAGVSSRRW